jgi:large subunit ribosomal protein L30
MAKQKKIKVTLVRSTNGRLASHKACVAGLGLRRMHHTVEVEDTPCTRGMINKVDYMVKEKPVVVATRGRNHVPVVSIKLDSKVAKCHYSVGSLKSVSVPALAG